MKETLKFIGKLFEVVLNRKLMSLIGGISVLLFVVFYYLVPTDLAVGGILKGSLVFGCIGAFGLIVHWGFDIDEYVKTKKSQHDLEAAKLKQYEEVERQIANLGDDQIAVLVHFVQSGKSSEYFGITDGKIADMAKRGILYTPSPYGTPVSTQAYCLTDIAAKIVRSGRLQQIMLERSKRRAT